MPIILAALNFEEVDKHLWTILCESQRQVHVSTLQGIHGPMLDQRGKLWHNYCNDEIFLYKPKGFFQFEIILDVLVTSFRFIWIIRLWVYGHFKYFPCFSAVTFFRRQNLTSIDVRFWRLKTVPALKGLNPHWELCLQRRARKKRRRSSNQSALSSAYTCYTVQNQSVASWSRTAQEGSS